MDTDALSGTLERELLTAPVRAALRRPTAAVLDWRLEAIYHPVIASTGGVYRVAGTARDHEGVVPWSLVLKVVRAPDGASAAGAPPPPPDDPRGRSYWEREVFAYRTGLLDDLPGGLVAPRCYGTLDRPGGVGLWLEDVDADRAPWQPARFRAVARALGVFNGAYLCGRAVPDAPWLLTEYMAQRARRFIPALRELSEARDHDVVRRGWPDDLLDRALRVCDTAPAWLATLARLPHTFQHGDADPRNLLVRVTSERQEQVVAIDWAFAGIGPLGDDVATLGVQSALWFQGVTPAQLPELAESCLRAYLAGLHDVGWDGDDADVRRGMVVTMAFRCLFRPVLERWALDDAGRARLQQVFGRAADEVIDCVALVRRFVLGQLEQVT